MKEIELSKTGTKYKGMYKALIDDDIFEEVNQYNWNYSSGGYAYNSKMRIQLHRFIWNLKYGESPEGMLVDHKDQNKLNCQLNNLRLATCSQNNRNKSKLKNNTSGFIGVSKEVQKRKTKNGIHIHEYWKCSCQDNFGKGRTKTFSYDNVGKVRAARYYDLMATQFGGNYTGELNFNSLSEYQHALKEAILKDIESK